MGEVSAGVEVPILISLHQYADTGKEGCISHEHKGMTGVGEAEYRGGLELLKEGINSSLLLGSP